jgi:hypothetical protein
LLQLLLLLPHAAELCLQATVVAGQVDDSHVGLNLTSLSLKQPGAKRNGEQKPYISEDSNSTLDECLGGVRH